MSITAKQALDAIYHLQHARDRAVLAHYAPDENGTLQRAYLIGLQEEFSKAAEALGFKLVAIEANQLRVIEGGGK